MLELLDGVSVVSLGAATVAVAGAGGVSDLMMGAGATFFADGDRKLAGTRTVSVRMTGGDRLLEEDRDGVLDGG